MRAKDPDRLAVENAWKIRYEGDSHEVLYENINGFIRDKAHSNSVAIVQSSGTGKSRMIDEMAKLVYTIPFNLRAPSETSGTFCGPFHATLTRNSSYSPRVPRS